MKNCIFITFDDRYVVYAKACIASLRENYPNHPPVLIKYNGNIKQVIDYFSSIPNVSLLDFKVDDQYLKSLNPGVIGSYMIYVRLILWTELFNEYDNLIYLDCDTIITKPFDEIVDSIDFFVVADNDTQGVFKDEFKHDRELSELLAEDQINFDLINTSMINSGMFVLPRKYRTIEHVEQLRTISDRYDKYIMHSDQSVLSIWVYLNRIPISKDFKYNFQTQFVFMPFFHVFDLESIKIMHFSAWKPDKNYSQLLKPAGYVVTAFERYERYRRLSEV
ncbi:MAG: hypothetical protein DI539_17825 [Flavobacterium psychrophilum]|jgi:lipopolysaccharide biosynthesis glycosyltransferase|nr:MAG: hypothetical protein DI539_17825 [Flavobacterium psychrophilum]